MGAARLNLPAAAKQSPSSYFMIWATLVAGSFASDIISDIGDQIATSKIDETRALEIKAERFWSSMLRAAEDMKMEEHVALYSDTEAVINSLGEEYVYVKEALAEALTRLRRADETVLLQGVQSSDVASNALATPVNSMSDVFSFFKGVNSFSQAIRRFVSGGQYSERLVQHIQDRQEAILPVLSGAAEATGNVLSDCRLASKRSFDVLKYDIYNKGVPRTPQSAKDVANRLVDASSDTRRRFTSFITEAATSIARDVEQQHQSAAAVITQSSLNKPENQGMAQLINL
mmetsp:Transcript_13345/g.31260  ORF Transcript_13345/g.31260 Transcript_13345/m.31260 type:complete len:288 (+) Transcript_13345:125-988(+)